MFLSYPAKILFFFLLLTQLKNVLVITKLYIIVVTKPQNIIIPKLNSDIQFEKQHTTAKISIGIIDKVNLVIAFVNDLSTFFVVYLVS